MRIRVFLVVATAVAAAWAAPSTASAEPPEVLVEEVNVVGLSPVLTAECGIDVTRSAIGTRRWQFFPDEDGILEILHSHIDVVAWSEHGEVTYRHRGIEKLFVEPDGTTYLLVAGQGPLGMKGRLLLDVTAEEFVVREAARSIDESIAEFCSVLNP